MIISAVYVSYACDFDDCDEEETAYKTTMAKLKRVMRSHGWSFPSGARAYCPKHARGKGVKP
jgi:hypothetical protein